MFGEVPVHRCIRHKERNVLDHRTERDRPAIKARLRRAWAETDHARARSRRRRRACAARRASAPKRWCRRCSARQAIWIVRGSWPCWRRASRRCAAGTAPRRTPLRPPAATSAAPLASRAVASVTSVMSIPLRDSDQTQAPPRRVSRHHPSEVDRRAELRGASSGLRQNHRDRPPTRCSFPHAQRPRRASRSLDAMLTSDPSR